MISSLKSAAMALLLATPLVASATDLGVQGNLWPILEVDIRQLMVESAARANIAEMQEAAKEQAKTFLQDLPKRKMPRPEKTSTVWMDPSLTLSSDIKAPVKGADGKITWRILAAAGTKVNPLEQYRPVTAMFFYDGADEDQVKLLKDLLKEQPSRIVPVETGGGDLKTISEAIERPVFYANPELLTRFPVETLPSLVYPGTGAHRLELGITTYAPPYTVKVVVDSWGDLTPLVPLRPKPVKKGASK